jgi:hypothetical protein
MRAKSIYKQHNLGEVHKHIVLGLNSEAARSADFNPFMFEMGENKGATRGC